MPVGHAGQYGLSRISRGELDAGYDTDGIGGGPGRSPRGGGSDVPEYWEGEQAIWKSSLAKLS